MQFKNWYNREKFPNDNEKNGLPSLTIPDQTMSVQEIMRRFAQGLSVDGERVPVYNGEEDLPDIERMDLVDRQEFGEALKEQIKEGRKKLQDAAQKEQKAKQLSIDDSEDQDRLRDEDQGEEAPPSKYPKKTPPEAPPGGSAKPRRRQDNTNNP